MKKTVYTLIGLSFLALGLSAYKTFDTPDYEDIDMSYNEFKNLKVLPKDITKDSLMGLMDRYSAALGVKYNFCHEMKGLKMDFASDAKHEKEVARHMITLTNELNAKEFAPIGEKYTYAVECATCHRGGKHPMGDVKKFNKKHLKKKKE